MATSLPRADVAPNCLHLDMSFHAAVMQNNGLTAIISTDAHFDRIAGIARLDPQQMFAAAREG